MKVIKFSEETRRKISDANKGNKNALGAKRSESFKQNLRLKRLGNNHGWKGDSVGNRGLHQWIRKRLPKPELCQMCNNKPSYDLANITGTYNREFHNWKYLCRSCHVKSDGRIDRLNDPKITPRSNQYIKRRLQKRLKVEE